jgi:hypothetical protein
VTILTGTDQIANTFNATPTTILLSGQTADASDVTSPTGLAVADFNRDTLPDLAVSAKHGVAVLVNMSTPGNQTTPGTVAFGSATVLSTTPTTSVATGSLDHSVFQTDQSPVPDIVATDTVDGQVLVFQNTDVSAATTPTFSAATLFAAGTSPVAVNVADLNGDGLGDIVVANDVATNATLTVLLNTTVFKPSGTETISFAPAQSYLVPGANPVALALGDSNLHHLQDAALADSTSDTFAVVPALTAGTFRSPSDVAWLQGVYLQLLNRPADTGAFNSWLPQLTAGDQAFIQGPGGSVSPVLSVTDLDSTNENFQVTFPAQVLDGTYTLTVGGVSDFSGNVMVGRYTQPFGVSTSDDGHFVSGLYHTLLGTTDAGGLSPADPPGGTGGRPADNSALLFATQVDAARSKVLSLFTPGYVTSAENVNNDINTLYMKFLHRPAGPSDLASWNAGIEAGTFSEQELTVILCSSQEYFDNNADNNGTWLNQMYEDNLGRPDTGDPGATQFLNYLNANSGTPQQGYQARQVVTGGIVFSGEGLGRTVYDTFVRFLDRAPTAAESQQWITTLNQPSGLKGPLNPYQQLETTLVTSSEFFAAAGNTTRGWVTALYSKLLQRATVDPNGGEVNTLLGAIINQPTFASARQTVINAILSSTEYQGRVVAYDFITYLKRSASASDIAGFVAITPPAGQRRDDYWLSLILGGGEYSGSTTNAAWLSKVYHDLFNRSVDGGTANPFLVQLNGGTSRQQVALELLTSPEYRWDLTAALFDRYLDRNKTLPQTGNGSTGVADDPEVNSISSLFNNGGTQEQAVAAVLGSQEFFLDPHSYP